MSRFFCTFVALLSAFTCTARAEDYLDEISVTATRRPTVSTELSSAISIAPAAEIQAHILTTDALAALVGVSLQQTTPGQGAAIIRGLKGSSILHLVDGIRLNNAIFRSAPTPYFALVPVAPLERLEVVRGTPAALYGSDAVGGVVQAITRLPDFATDAFGTEGSFGLRLDSAEQLRTVRGTVDFGTQQLASSISAEYQQTGDRRIGGGERVKPTGYEAGALRAVVRGRPDDDRSWYLDVHLLEQPATPRIDELVAGFGQSEPSSSEYLFEPNRRQFVHFQYENVHGVFDFDWKLDAAWQRVDDDRTSRNFGAATRRYEENRSDLYALTLNMSAGEENLSWIAGLDVYYDEVASSRYEEDLQTGGIAAAQARFPDGSSILQAALFGNLRWHASDRHWLSGGLRFTEVSIDLPEAFSTATVRIGRLSGDLGWTFDIADHWQIVSNLGFGFRAPNIFDLGTLGERPGNRYNVPNPDLAEEESTQLDLGVRYRTDQLQWQLVAYGLRYTDGITSAFTGDVTPDGRDIVQSVNAASTDIHGLEAGLSLAIGDAITVEGKLNYARGDQDLDGTFTEPADRIPPLSGRIAVEFMLDERWSFDAWLRAASSQDRLSERDANDPRINPAGTPGWGLAGASATWRPEGGWQIDLGIDNMFDRRYRQHGSGIDAPGRNYFLGLSRNW